MKETLEQRYRFFREHAGYIVGRSAVGALALARAEMAAEERGDVKVTWEDECEPWDGEGPAPEYLLCCVVECAGEYASLGRVGVDSMRDPYLRVVEAELKAEVLAAQKIRARGWATCAGGIAA